MSAAVAITQMDYTARRILALAHVMDGRSRGEAATLCGMDR